MVYSCAHFDVGQVIFKQVRPSSAYLSTSFLRLVGWRYYAPWTVTPAAFAELHRPGKEKAGASMVQSTDLSLIRPIKRCKNLLPCLL
jgi:hypothetical protein